jgi:excisionase family DNA binding protein
VTDPILSHELRRDRAYRPREVVAVTHLPRELVYAALRSGEIPAVRRGARWLIAGGAVLDYLESLGRR